MRITKKETCEILVTEDILCNSCGHTCQQNTTGYYGLIEVEVCGGFDSIPEIGDLKVYKFSLCEQCLFALFKTFQIAPSILEYEI